MVQMADGTRLATDLYMPLQLTTPGTVPCKNPLLEIRNEECFH
jgi:predicted acyl esterase